MRGKIESHQFDLIKEDIKRNIERSLTFKYLERSSSLPGGEVTGYLGKGKKI